MNQVFGPKLGWDDIEALTDNLADQCLNSGIQPDMIVAIARGGLIPATQLAHKLDVRRVRSFQMVSYIDGVQGALEHIDSSQNLIEEMERPNVNCVLFVEDIVDTGASLQYLRKMFTLPQGYKCVSVFASLTVKKKAPKADWPTMYAHVYPEDAWVTFPWEMPK